MRQTSLRNRIIDTWNSLLSDVVISRQVWTALKDVSTESKVIYDMKKIQENCTESWHVSEFDRSANRPCRPTPHHWTFKFKFKFIDSIGLSQSDFCLQQKPASITFVTCVALGHLEAASTTMPQIFILNYYCNCLYILVCPSRLNLVVSNSSKMLANLHIYLTLFVSMNRLVLYVQLVTYSYPIRL